MWVCVRALLCVRTCMAPQTRLSAFYWSAFFQSITAVAIIVNVSSEAAKLQLNPDEGSLVWNSHKNVDMGLTLFFMVELLINATAHLGHGFLAKKRDWFDLIVALFGLAALLPDVYLLLPFSNSLRLLRVLRLMEVLFHFRSLRQIIKALSASIVPLTNAMLLVLSVVAFYAILGVHMYGTKKAAHFKTFARSCFTMLQVTTLDSWSSLARDLWKEDGTMDAGVVVFFTSFIFVVAFTLLPVVVAVLLDAFAAESTREKTRDDRVKLLSSRESSQFGLDALMETLMESTSDEELASRLAAMFDRFDKEGQGVLGYPEVFEGLSQLDFVPTICLTLREYETIARDHASPSLDAPLESKGHGEAKLYIMDRDGWERMMREQLSEFCQRQVSVWGLGFRV